MNMPVTATPRPSSQTTSLVLNSESLGQMMKLAEIMATGRATLPKHFNGNPADCLAVVMQAMQWQMNPFAVAQKTHVVSGVLGYEAQLVNAVITACAPTKDRLNYEWFGDWTKVIGKFEIKRGEKGEYRVPGWKMADEEGLGVKVWATFRGEEHPRVLEILLSQARVRNSTLWADDPRQQLAYLATKRWSRLFCPDVIMGVYSPDELEEIQEREVAPVVQREQQAPQAKPEYPAEKFTENLPKWRARIEKKKATPEDVLATLTTAYTVTEEQRQKINALAPIEAAAEPAQQEDAPAAEQEPQA